MKTVKWNWRYFWVMFLVILVLVNAAGGGYLYWLTGKRKQAARKRAVTETTVIEKEIEAVSGSADILEAWLKTAGSDKMQEIAESEDEKVWLEEFNDFASSLYDSNLLYSLQLAPKGVIRYIYPYEANKGLIDTDLLGDESPEKKVLQPAAEGESSGDTVVYGPLFVSHIGLSLNIRKPVYYQNGKFWGYVSAVMALPGALQQEVLDRLTEDGYRYGIYYQDDNGFYQTVTGSLAMDSGAVRTTFTVQNRIWYVLLYPEKGWVSARLIVPAFMIMLLVVLVLAVLLTLRKSVQKEKLQELKSDAEHDQMTGLLNHEACAAMIQKKIGEPVGGVLFMIDIDYFKQVNDSAGHLVGDQVLISVSQALRGTFRKNDVIGRYGGDEFVVYMPGSMSVPDFSVKASQFQKKIRQIQIKNLDRTITCSMGIARKYTDTIEVSELVGCADKALYESKRGGKDRFTIYEDPLRMIFVDQEEAEPQKADFTYRD